MKEYSKNLIQGGHTFINIWFIDKALNNKSESGTWSEIKFLEETMYLSDLNNSIFCVTSFLGTSRVQLPKGN